MPLHKLLSKVFRGLKLCGPLRGPENLQASLAENINHSGGKRRLWPYDSHGDAVLLRKIRSGLWVLRGVDGDIL